MMTDFSLFLPPFVFGALVAAAVAFLLFKRQTTTLLLSNAMHSKRVSELETQLTRQAEEFSNQLAAKTREHMDELERLARERRQLEENHLGAITAKVREAENRGYDEGKRQAELRTNEKAKAFSVTVRPYIRTSKVNILPFRKYRLEIGYQYQLEVNGIPCFSPHVVTEQHYEEKEVNQEVIERMAHLALEAAKTAVVLKAGPAGALISIAERPVIEDEGSKR